MDKQTFHLTMQSSTLPYAEVGTEVGVDEAGRGCLAGPVVAAAVHLPHGHNIIGLNDSKKLSAQKRQILAHDILRKARVGIGLVWQKDIDRLNILQATLHAMAKAVAALLKRCPLIPFLHIDGNAIVPPHVISLYLQNVNLKQRAIVGGDGLVESIAAASIVAKTHRDTLLKTLSVRWPEYNFAKHKGYGTKEHMNAIEKHGACPLHRLSFAPFKSKEAQPLRQGNLCI